MSSVACADPESFWGTVERGSIDQLGPGKSLCICTEIIVQHSFNLRYLQQRLRKKVKKHCVRDSSVPFPSWRRRVIRALPHG